jgi:shikimate kinase
VLIGMMGSGKTTVGRVLAERLGRGFVDSDEVIQSRTGRTVREIFESDGEAAFRVLETDALLDALEWREPLVVAAAGGVVLAEENRQALRQGAARIVWLTAPVAVLAARA